MRHVIVGAGPAGMAALQTIRALEPDAEIALVCDELPCARMVLPYYLLGNIEEQAVWTADEAWLAEQGVEAHIGRRATSLDTAGKQLALDDGSTLAYDRLLVATGSRATRPPIDGADGEGIVNMWTLDDANAYLGAGHDETVIVGAGFIAFTILDAIAKRSKRVSFVEIEPQILPRMLDREAADCFEGALAKRGISFHKGAAALRIEQTAGRRRLHLAGGATLDADAVVMATGIQPNLEWLAGSGIELDHGILVDESLQSSAEGVYAAGDVAQGLDLSSGERRVHAIQPTATDHGRIAGAGMAGERVCYAGSLTMNILAAQGLEACSFGLWDGAGSAISNPGDGIYRKYVWGGDAGDVLVGGVLVGPTLAVSGTNDVGMLKGLVQTGTALGPWKAYLEENPLDLRRVFVASGAAKQLLASTLLTGRASTGGGFRFPKLAPVRARKPHHAEFVGGAPR
jgi:NAD(P)H-nitrite reductase large subunit